MEQTAIQQAKQWLEQNAHTPWALMRLELMEEMNPTKLQALVQQGTLLQSVKAWNEELTQKHMELTQTGDYNQSSEIGDVMRAELIAEAQGEPMSVQELLDRALTQGEKLTEEEKDFLRENLPPRLAMEVDYLP